VSDDGLARFCGHNQVDGGLSHITLDHPGDIGDAALTTIADHCPSLVQFSLARCPRVTNAAVRSLTSGVWREIFGNVLETSFTALSLRMHTAQKLVFVSFWLNIWLYRSLWFRRRGFTHRPWGPSRGSSLSFFELARVKSY